MPEYIEREAIKTAVRKRLNNSLIIGWLIRIINEIPAADVAPVVHGRWKHRAHLNDFIWAECSNCGFKQENYKVVKMGRSDTDYVGVKWHYCPNCGARMDGDVE